MFSDTTTAPVVVQHDVQLDDAAAEVRELMARRKSISQRWWVERSPIGAWERFGSDLDDS